MENYTALNRRESKEEEYSLLIKEEDMYFQRVLLVSIERCLGDLHVLSLFLLRNITNLERRRENRIINYTAE